MSDFSKRIASETPSFTNSQKNVADYISGHLNKVAFYTLDELSRKIGVSTTTIIRFSRVLGYDGFSEMQKAIQEDIYANSAPKARLSERLPDTAQPPDNELLSDCFQNDIENIRQTLAAQKGDDLDAAVDSIIRARSVYILGMRSSFSPAYYMASRLGEIRKNVHLIQSVGMIYPEEIVNAGEDDVCIAYLFPRYSKVSSSIISWMKNAGSKVILITSLNYQAVSGYGDIILPCAISSLSYKNSFAAPLCLTNYLITAMARQNHKEAQSILEKTESILSQGFYLGL
ncbi:MurR/RpiR family transcriptional regulator [Clostridium sp. AF19-22AC]|jgi:DNA-binding MurR/RpiR family transcriptional regulator|uniref:RpiR family transcriptional regulator n=1 Tax=Faecalicatena orotica TaxID=1544 RepID=A0A2Y9BFQ3_9FIRM|nr:MULTISPECIES: MurR/RpiR family transcriptional regulator [Clostridia]PWJ30139.1 RpiR family transcriptional regulator [Faecalicatena orotica]RHR30780.1 MurR/RpiR family transcriptional regulator [Clostridium sp. AF19-22AC]SSA55128.1 transcriptional regulator, RpiR family [Faecalicatena orotica]